MFTDWIGNDNVINLEEFPHGYIYSREEEGIVWHTIEGALANGSENEEVSPETRQTFEAEMARLRKRRAWLLRVTQLVCHSIFSQVGVPRDITKLIASYVIDLPAPEARLLEPFCDSCSMFADAKREDFGEETQCQECGRMYCFIDGCSLERHPDPEKHRHFNWTRAFDSGLDNSEEDDQEEEDDE